MNLASLPPARATLAGLSLLVVLAVLAGCGGPAAEPGDVSGSEPGASGSASADPRQPAPTTPAPVDVTTTRWASGASGSGVADGDFGAWRGDDLTIAGTWNDDLEAQINQWSVVDGGEYADWAGDLDVAIGAIYQPDGETWAAAASGAYDERWRATLQTLQQAWAGHSGTLYLRFAHEFNGSWEPWSVSGADVEDFRAAWARFRALQQEVLPDAQLVFCPNNETSAKLDLDWRDAFPGADQVDVMAVDYYNFYPFVTDEAGFEAAGLGLDDRGAPRGLEAHRAYAQSAGLPFAVPEWGSNGELGDGTPFLTSLRSWFEAHAGSGPGQVVYEIAFNVERFEGRYELYPQTLQQGTSATYSRLW